MRSPRNQRYSLADFTILEQALRGVDQDDSTLRRWHAWAKDNRDALVARPGQTMTAMRSSR